MSSPRLEAAEESAQAHQEATGHDRCDMVQVSRFPVVVVVTCHQCGQHLGTVSK